MAQHLDNTGTDAVNLSSCSVLVQGVDVGCSLTTVEQNGLE